MGLKYTPAIDGLRAVAVLSVVAYHAGAPAGFVGVDVFFVISGYVITRMLLQDDRIDLLAFYARRVRRILPALLVVVAVTLALSAAMLSADLQIATNRSAMASMAMAANVWFQFHTGYFDAASDQMPLLHLWSLAVEEQFYFVWPLLLIAFRRKPWVLALLALASFVLAEYWIRAGEQGTAFYQMPSRFWELAVGGLLVMVPASRAGHLTAAGGLVAMCVAVATSVAAFPGAGAVLAVLGTLLVLHAIHSGLKIPPLEWTPVRYVGLVSYSFYLWHWPLLAIARATGEPTLATRLALCGLAFGLACLSYHFVELPFRRRQARPRAIAVGVGACIALAGCSGAMETALRRSDSLSVRTALDGPPESACQGVDATCDADVVLWGDSHARMWEPLAETYGSVHQVTLGGCMASTRKSQFRQCWEFNRKAGEIARKAKVVVLGGFWLDRLKHEPSKDLESALALLADKRVIVVGPVPELPATPQACIRGEASCDVTRREFEDRAAPVRATLKAQLSKYPNVEYVEPAGWFCTDTNCPLMKGGRSLYWDDDHVTASAARGFARSLETRPSAE